VRQKDKRFWTGVGLVSSEMLATMVLFTGAVAGFFLVTRKRWRRYKKWDLDSFDRIQHLVTPQNNKLMLFITKLGKHQFLIPANLSLLGWYLFFQKRTWFSIRVVSIALSSLGLMLLFKQIFRRKRPVNPLLSPVKGMSFPSGHAMMSVAFYGLLIYVLSNTTKRSLRPLFITPLVALITMIGFSRVYLRVHYTSDVMAGFTIGISWLLISLRTLKRLEAFNREQVKLLTQPA
jgi:membrane-associated phospholipid phosphatase